MQIKKAVIPVAGFGTRFLPITKALPKTMLPIVDKPAIHYLVEEAVNSGIAEIIIITGQDKKPLEDYFNRSKALENHLINTGKLDLLEMIKKISSMAEIHFVTQEEVLGLGHAIYCARRFMNKDEAFAVLLGDDVVVSIEPCISQLIKVFNNYQASIIGVQNVPNSEVSKYGIVSGHNVTDRLVKVGDLVEKPDEESAPSNLAILGRYIIHSEIFDILRALRPGAGGEIQLTDALKELNKTQEVYSYIFQGTRYDTGNKLGHLKATIDLALQDETIGHDFKNYLIKMTSHSR
ncbi:UTP--glucose-1-phosphate uridylyltransferase [Desulfitispora alkaliphila]|uniref:UTP--glucose-1-phosphate uridylyltransferase GalU n=1 Tax=Desulfitispora alkaliphila TaxID=622674 RepID=UPI003D1F8E9B